MKKLIVFFGLLIFIPPAALAAGTVSDYDYSSTKGNLKKASRLLDKKDYAEAAIFLESVVAKDADSADAWNLYGFSLRKSGDVNKARTAYDRALALDPGHLGANSYLGELFLQTGDIGRAKAQLQKFEQLCPQGCKERDDLARAIAEAG